MKTLKPKRKKAAGKRQYNNLSRAKKSTETQKVIVETLVEILVEKRGADVSFEEIAKRSKVSERSIFRFFKDKKTLHAAMDQYLLTYLASSREKMKLSDFVTFAKNLFQLFDSYESLTMAYLFSPFGHEARRLLRKKFAHEMINKIIEERKLQMTPDRKKRFAIICSLVNAKIWYDLKSDFDLNSKEREEALEWALQTLLKDLE